MATEQATSLTPELKRRLLDFEEPTPLETWLEKLVATSDDEEIAFWVAVTHGLLTSTIAAHLDRADTYTDAHLRTRLSINPEAPLEAMRSIPVNEHLHYGLTRFVERNGFSLESNEAGTLVEAAESELLLGEVWDSIVSTKV